MSQILGASARPMVCLGGETAHRIRVTGDIVSSYQWVSGEPAMVLFPRERKMGGGAYVICLSSAHNYAEQAYLVSGALTAATIMGMDQTKATVMRIADVILDGLEDLVRMPPEPPKGMKLPGVDDRTAEVSLKVDGETVLEKQVEIDGAQL
jgi:hypothetical protein